MNDEKLKNQLGANIVMYRKRSGLTQAKLAERLNYSDKAVSKWERGESMPDVLTLTQLAELFDITVNDLLIDPDALPAQSNVVERAVGKAVEKTFKRKADKKIILMLCSVLVWFVALLAFVVVFSLDIPNKWQSFMAFIYAIPINSIVAVSLNSAWRDFRRNKLFVSGIVWGSLLSIYLSLLIFMGINIWMLFLLGIPGQAAVLLWGRLFHAPKEKKQDE